MPVTDPFKSKIVEERLLNKSICRRCGARNPPGAVKCRRCKSRNLRPKKRFGGKKS